MRVPGRPFVGHADLLRVAASLRLASPAEALAVAARLLGFERELPAPKPESPLHSEPEPEPAHKPTPEPPRPADPHAPLPTPFWRPTTFSWKSDEELDRAARHALDRAAIDEAEDDAERRAMAAIAPPEVPPLTSPSRLLPLLQRAVTADLPGRALDLPALLRRWSRGELVRRLPRLRRRGWPTLILLVDRSFRLIPFWADQRAVVRLLRDRLGEAGLIVRYFDDRGPEGGALAAFGDNAGRPAPLTDGSLAGTPILALTDLGWYEGPATRRAWLRLGRELRRAGERIHALVPVPPRRWTPDLAALWSPIPWERPQRGPDDSADSASVENLLNLAALTTRLEPGLLRAFRRLLPPGAADLATEAAAWAHPDIESQWASATHLRTSVIERRRRAAADLDPALLARARDALHRWHWNAERSPELWHLETLGLAALNPTLLSADAIARAEAGMERIARRAITLAQAGGSPSRLHAIARWLDHLARHAPPLLAPHTRAGRALQQAWGATHPPDDLPPDPDLAQISRGRRPGRPKPAAIRQLGAALEVIWPEALARQRHAGAPIATLWAGDLHLVPHAHSIHLTRTDRARVPLRPPRAPHRSLHPHPRAPHQAPLGPRDRPRPLRPLGRAPLSKPTRQARPLGPLPHALDPPRPLPHGLPRRRARPSR